MAKIAWLSAVYQALRRLTAPPVALSLCLPARTKKLRLRCQ